MMNDEWIKNLKPGDHVIIERSMGYPSSVGEVKRITPSGILHVSVGTNPKGEDSIIQFNPDGCQRGRASSSLRWSSWASLDPYNAERHQKIHNANMVAALNSWLHSHTITDPAKAEQVMAILGIGVKPFEPFNS